MRNSCLTQRGRDELKRPITCDTPFDPPDYREGGLITPSRENPDLEVWLETALPENQEPETRN